MKVSCAWSGCAVEFEAQRSTAKYHSATCRQRAARDRKAATGAVKSEAAATDPDDPSAKHPLLVAVERELEAADALATVDGQAALQLARRVVESDAKGVATLIKEMRAVLAAATGSKLNPTGGADDADGNEGAEPEDEVTAARRAREEARQAAGLA